MKATQTRWVTLLLSVLILLCGLSAVIALVGSWQMVNQPFPGFRYEATLTVSAVSDPAWSGAKAKLLQYDRLLSVDGQPLTTPDDLRRYVEARPVGSLLTYQIQREGKRLAVTVPTGRFAIKDWLQGFFPLILIGLLHLVVGAIAFWVKPSSPTARAHLYMCAVICVFFAAGNDYDAGRSMARLYLLALPLLGATFIHLGLAFPSLPTWLRRRGWLAVLPYLPVLLLVGYWQTIYRPTGMLGNPTHFDDSMGLQDLSLLYVMLGLLVLIASIIIRLVRSRSALERQQIKIALFGAALAYLPGTLLWIVPYLASNHELDGSGVVVFVSYAFFVAFPISIAYAIVRHRLFDIDLIIKRTVVYTAVIASLLAAYFLTIAGMTWVVEHFTGHADSSLGNIFATAVVALAFVPVRQRTQALMDRLFFRNRYDFRSVVSAFTRVTKENPELEAVLDEFVAVVERTVHPRFLTTMVRDAKLSVLRIHRTAGLAVFPEDYVLPAESPEVAELTLAKRTGLKPSRSTTRQLSHMQTLGIAFVVPLEIQGQILGLVTVGPKLSDLDYTAEDEALLMNLGQQLASIIRIAEMTASEVSRARLDAELETARMIQASLLPTNVQTPLGLQVAASSEPAYEFGGDYYDLLTTPDGQLRVVVGDVAGKGVQAALVMAMTKSCFFNQVRTDPQLPVVMQALNAMIMGSIDDKKHRKTTLIYGAIDVEQRTLRYACAGHQPPHHFNARTGSVEDLPIPGSFPFGASKLVKYQEYEVPLNSGDVLVFYTDGITEAENAAHEMFYRIEEGPNGQEVVHDQLRLLLEAHHDKSADEIHRRIVQAVKAWVGDAPQGDDLTLVVVKVD